MTLTQLMSSGLTAFLASLVEFVEALTIVLAVGTTRGWKPALLGTLMGGFFLIVLVAFFGPALQNIPIEKLQLVIGVLLLLFGMRWLRKAILRSAGVIPLHDEEKIFFKESESLRRIGLHDNFFFKDPAGVITAFKAVVLEGVEVVFIVIATGSGTGSLSPAIAGATLAGVLVIALGFIVHKPLSRVPENELKFAVGLLLSAFGIFWVGEGLRYPWPGADFAILPLLAALLLVSLMSIRIAKAVGSNENF
jgi:uncharacterized membrane protein